MSRYLILVGFCMTLASCGLPTNYDLDKEVCTGEDEYCQTTRDRLQERHWVYRWYYFIAYPFVQI